jgi:hypothetical protein
VRANRLAVRGVPAEAHEGLFGFLIRHAENRRQGEGPGAGRKQKMSGHIRRPCWLPSEYDGIYHPCQQESVVYDGLPSFLTG